MLLFKWAEHFVSLKCFDLARIDFNVSNFPIQSLNFYTAYYVINQRRIRSVYMLHFHKKA